VEKSEHFAASEEINCLLANVLILKHIHFLVDVRVGNPDRFEKYARSGGGSGGGAIFAIIHTVES
jgi:hypothetical protein